MTFFLKTIGIMIFIAAVIAVSFRLQKKIEIKKMEKMIVATTTVVESFTESLDNKKKDTPLLPAVKKEVAASISKSVLSKPKALPEKTLLPVPISIPMTVPQQIIPPPTPLSVSSPVIGAATSSHIVPAKPSLPPLDEAMLLNAVVKIECATKDALGKYVGSGFVISNNRVVTAAHLVKDSGSELCRVIFPHERKPIYYLKGTIENLKDITSRHDEMGIDVAVLRLPPVSEYSDAYSIFPNGYPFISYPICTSPVMLGDQLLHFGYPSNFLDQNYLSEYKGEAVLYADINGIENKTSLDNSTTFKSPIFGYTQDETTLHPYMVSRVPAFYGDSGGLVFNATKQCILGPTRGGTVGGREGENYSVFPVLGWPKAGAVLGN